MNLLTIALPVLNEEERIENGVGRLSAFIAQHQLPFSICIADNGSQDRTFELATAMKESNHNISLIRLPEKGVGRALKLAWSMAETPYVGYMDIDLATDLEHLLRVKELIDQNKPVINGSRLLKDSIVENRKLIREISSRGFNQILKARLGIGFSDGMCGFKFLQRAVFVEITRKFSPLDNGWFFNAEVIIKSEWLGHKVEEIPVRWRDDQNSKVKLVNLTKEYLRQIERVRKQKP